jgi:MFS family permease
MSGTRIRLGAAALAIAGVMFVLYPALRPWHDETTTAGAIASMGSTNWVLAHFFAMIGFILAPLGLLALRRLLAEAGSQGERLAAGAFATTWIGAGLTLPYYGAEDFGLHAAAQENVPGLLALVHAVRYNPLAITIFGVGLLLVAVGGVLVAVAVWRSGVLGRTAGLAYGLGMALFLPQFFAPAAVRIGHGILLGAGCVILAAALIKRVGAGEVRALKAEPTSNGIMAR